tara:strand:+ start:3101 stop:3388 length:288 start_codon:yes stop_codon:yes gene_type:complete
MENLINMGTRKTVEINGNEIVVQETQILMFQNEIEKLSSNGDISYLEAIYEYCESNNVEIDTVKNLISKNLMSKITQEAEDRKLIKGEPGARLPI